MFEKEQIVELKNKVNKIQFFSQFMQIHECGKYLRAICPFHADHNPSLDIDEESGLWICRSCGAHGDLISFYQKITGKSFTESVMDIAKSQDIKLEISEELKKEYALKKSLYGINNAVATIYQKALIENKDGQNYIVKRGFNLDVIKKFKIGYIPKYNLSNLGNQYIPILREAGLLNTSDDNSLYNYFSTNRISIPFCDEYGHIVGFSSRAITNDIKPKYLHSKTNVIFKKDELLFGYHLAKEKIKETKSVIFTEGQIDCIKAHQYGIENCVALCGLALSDKQMKLLKTYVKNYYIVVEDKAGEKALDRIYDIVSAENFYANIKIIRLYKQKDEKCDLDEFLTLYGKGEFLEKIKKAPTYHEYKLIDSLKNINYKTIEEKKFHIYNNRKYIAKITNPIDKKQYIELLSNKLELPENDVRKIIARAEQTDSVINIEGDNDRRVTAQKYIIASFFSYFGVQTVYKTVKELHAENKLNNQFKKIFSKIVDIILLNGSNSDLINIIHTAETMNADELKIVDNAYFRRDEFDYLQDEHELKLFIQDQLENLR